MTDDIKSLLDSIIDDTNNSYKGKEELLSSDDNGGNQIHRNHCHCHPVTFDSGKFREKLSLFVLKDLISGKLSSAEILSIKLQVENKYDKLIPFAEV